jgi:Membrane transport protein.
VLVDISRVIVVMILPIGFFALGSALAEEAEEGSFAFPPKFDKLVAMGVVGRMVLPPLLLALLAWPLIDVPETYLVLAGISTGVNPLVVSHVYGLDQRVTAGTIAWSTVFAILGLVAFAIVRAA